MPNFSLYLILIHELCPSHAHKYIGSYTLSHPKNPSLSLYLSHPNSYSFSRQITQSLTTQGDIHVVSLSILFSHTLYLSNFYTHPQPHSLSIPYTNSNTRGHTISLLRNERTLTCKSNPTYILTCKLEETRFMYKNKYLIATT